MAYELNETLWCDMEFIKTLRIVSKSAEAEDFKKKCDEHGWQIEEQLVRLTKAAALTGVNLEAKPSRLSASLAMLHFGECQRPG